MAGVHSIPVGRQDVLLHRGSDERIGIHWLEGGEEKDIHEWACSLSLSDPNGGELLSVACESTEDGYAIGHLTAQQTTSLAATHGKWRIVGEEPDGEEQRLLGIGGYAME